MDEKIIYSLWRKYLVAAHANTATEWKKYISASLRANVFPTVACDLDFIEFVEHIRDNVFENKSEETENEHE